MVIASGVVEFFMISLFKGSWNPKAHAVVIKGGEEQREFVTDFTHESFNHIILLCAHGKRIRSGWNVQASRCRRDI